MIQLEVLVIRLHHGSHLQSARGTQSCAQPVDPAEQCLFQDNVLPSIYMHDTFSKGGDRENASFKTMNAPQTIDTDTVRDQMRTQTGDRRYRLRTEGEGHTVWMG